MKPIPFEGSNAVLKGPRGMEDCGDLHVYRDGETCYSEWEPNPEERAAIAAGGRVLLWVWMGNTQPPVALGAKAPPHQEPPKMPQHISTPNRFVAFAFLEDEPQGGAADLCGFGDTIQAARLTVRNDRAAGADHYNILDVAVDQMAESGEVSDIVEDGTLFSAGGGVAVSEAEPESPGVKASEPAASPTEGVDEEFSDEPEM